MHSDARTLPDNTEIEADLCVIGAGAAGISIAREFAGTRYDVTLLEAGGFELESSIQSLYEGKNVGLPLSIRGSRLRYFGGTTNHWEGWCSILDPIDFVERDWIPMSGWPLKLGELEQYYRRAHPICDLGEYNYDIDYWENKWWDGFAPLPFEDSPLRTKVFKYSAPTRFGQKYRSEILNSRNITLWTHANVTEIKTPVSGARVSGLQVECLNGKNHSVKARQYVLACGGLENPRLLLDSNTGHSKGVGNEKGLVGKYFLGHPTIRIGNIVFKEWPDINYWRKSSGKPFGVLSTNYNFQKKRRISNYSCYISPIWKKGNNVIKKGLKYYLGKPPKFKATAKIEQIPKINSKLTLCGEKDKLGVRKIKLNWIIGEQDYRTIKIGSQMMGRELGRLGLGRLQLQDWIINEDKDRPSSPPHHGYHHMGTTRMSESPEKGVVNSDCKVHTVENLYVAGSSVYPTSGIANPTLTLVALAIRLSDHLKERLKL